MAKPPAARAGARFEISRRPIPFSYWPARRGRRHHALQSLLFALDPWIVIRRAIEERCPEARQVEALSVLDQARDFHLASSQAGVTAAKPVLIYYCYMNLVKAFCLTKGAVVTFERAQHGLAESLTLGGNEYVDATLDAYPTPNRNGQRNNFADFLQVLTGRPLAAQISYPVPHVLPQILPGHRLWSQANQTRERFISAESVEFWHSKTNKQIWIRIYFSADDLSRLHVGRQALLNDSGLSQAFRLVRNDREKNGSIDNLVCFEQTTPTVYVGDHPADAINHLASSVKDNLWSTVSTVPPYRRYYVYLSPAAELGSRMPQLLSIYATSYYFGSITRYRPHHFDNLMASKWAARIQDFVEGQAPQFLYLMASEFCEQDVTQPSIL